VAPTPIHPLALAATLFSAAAFSQPIEAKLDHVVIAVHDLKAAQRTYAALGFAITPGARHPNGTQNSMVRFSDGGYLELITPYDVSLPEGRRYAEYLEQNEGATAAALEVKGQPPAEPHLVFFIHDVPDPPNIPPHPNSASSLKALLIAVNDNAAYANLGKASAAEIPLPELGAIAKQIVLERGSILLLRATDPSGPHSEGILGVQLTVSDLDETRRSIGRKNISKDDRSVIVSPENAAGIWLQFQPERP
jgi:catechol 2,3-dioxygenase-like lactoylglutathione lyase family enzyme